LVEVICFSEQETVIMYKLSGHKLAAVRRTDIQLKYPIEDYLAVHRWAKLRLPNGQIA
jgi:hypothetical protein